MNAPTHFLPHNTIIACDLHGVIFSSSVQQILSIVWHCPHKIKFLRLIMNIPLVCTVIRGVRNKYVIEQLIQELSYKHPLFNQFKDTALAVANAQKVNIKTLEIFKKLHENNYTLIAFSNIGQQSMRMLSTRYPEIFSLFSHIIHTSAQDNFVAKPAIEAFNKLLTYTQEKDTILIDDNARNINQARTLGIHPIRFYSAKSLKHELKKHIIF